MLKTCCYTSKFHQSTEFELAKLVHNTRQYQSTLSQHVRKLIVRSAWVFALSVGTQASQVRHPLTVLIVTMHTGTESLTFRKPVVDSRRSAVQSTDASAASQQLQRSCVGRHKHTRWSRSYAAAACRTAYRTGIVCQAASTPPTKGKSISFTIPIDYSQVLLQLSCSVITDNWQSRQFPFRQRLLSPAYLSADTAARLKGTRNLHGAANCCCI